MLSTFTSYRLIAKNLSQAIQRKGAESTVARETAYYQANIEKVKTVEDLLSNQRLYAYAMKAHGLEDMTYAKAFMRKVLNEGVDAKSAFANRLTDERYRAFAKVFDFTTYGADTTLRTATNDKTVAAYHRQQLENDAGADDTGVRLALYFARKAPEVTTGYAVLADTALSQVVKTVLGLPDAGASETALARQAELIETKLDLASFKDPAKLEKFLQRFTAIWDAQNNAATAPVLSLFTDSPSAGLDANLLLSLQRIRSGS